MYSTTIRILLVVLSTEFQVDASVINFHDEDFFGNTADTYDWSKHPCRRDCSKKNSPETCQYVFVVEQFYAMSKACYNCPVNVTDCFRPHCIPVDGFPKSVYTVNRQLPGPSIEVCEHDTIIVDVRNRMLSESTTIHWHGFKQHGTPYMDGVPYVTQCPILPGQNFRYKFRAADPGTYFYHSHIGIQRSDGLFGPLIVKKSARHERMAGLYDHDDFHMIIIDWTHKPGNEITFYGVDRDVPDTILINGLGRFPGNDSVSLNTPLATFNVEPGKKYRFRFINAGSDECPIVMSVDNHTMLVISMDGNDIEPVEVDVITSWPGERVDFVLKANQRPDNYWFRFSGNGMCAFNDTFGIYQSAVLKYTGSPHGDPKGTVKYSWPNIDKQRVLNHYNLGSETKSSNNIDIPKLKALDDNDISLRESADQQVYLSFDFYAIDNYDYNRKGLYGFNEVSAGRFSSLMFNNISLKMPSFPLMSQWNKVKPDSFCNSTHLPNDKDCTSEQFSCTHVIQLKKNAVIELVFVATGPDFPEAVSLHPLHLHGHFFRVVAMERLDGYVTVDRVKKLDREGRIRRNLDRAPMKDTIKTPHGGYTIVRFYTNNPGYWFFHCHMEPHVNVGMALIFKAGEHEDFAPKPKGFPSCGNYVPENSLY